MNRPLYIPENSTPITRPGIPAIVYVYINKQGSPGAIAYKSKATKPIWHYRFATEAARDLKIAELFANLEYYENQKRERRAENQTFRHGYTAGDILYSSWGYDQTNIEYFQVIETTEKTVTFREIAQNRTADGFMSGYCSPRKDEFLDKPEFTRKVSPPYKGGKGTIHFAEHEGGYMRYLWEWDGAPLGYSEYA
jgi:hypothetical protein